LHIFQYIYSLKDNVNFARSSDIQISGGASHLSINYDPNQGLRSPEGLSRFSAISHRHKPGEKNEKQNLHDIHKLLNQP